MSEYRASKTAAGQGLRWFFFRPPRRHGEVDYDREVSFIELFYDLVYVVVIGRAAHHLATHVSRTGLGDIVVVFGLSRESFPIRPIRFTGREAAQHGWWSLRSTELVHDRTQWCRSRALGEVIVMATELVIGVLRIGRCGSDSVVPEQQRDGHPQ